MNENVISNSEDVARVLFYPSFFNLESSPFFSEGVLSPIAFKLQILKSGKPESSISVLRTLVETFIHDVAKLFPRNNDDLKCGYALLDVGEVREIRIPSTHNLDIEVVPTGSKRLRSLGSLAKRKAQGLFVASACAAFLWGLT